MIGPECSIRGAFCGRAQGVKTAWRHSISFAFNKTLSAHLVIWEQMKTNWPFRNRSNLLKKLVGARGFEPPTPWSRTRFQNLLNFVEICCFQVILLESVAAYLLKLIEID